MSLHQHCWVLYEPSPPLLVHLISFTTTATIPHNLHHNCWILYTPSTPLLKWYAFTTTVKYFISFQHQCKRSLLFVSVSRRAQWFTQCWGETEAYATVSHTPVHTATHTSAVFPATLTTIPTRNSDTTDVLHRPPRGGHTMKCQQHVQFQQPLVGTTTTTIKWRAAPTP